MSNNKLDPEWRVYKYTNKINGKCYIGMTSQSLQKRASKDGANYKTKYLCSFYKAIQEFGWDSFIPEILVDNIKDKKEALKLEGEYINLFNSCEDGYNDMGKQREKKRTVSKIKTNANTNTWYVSEESKQAVMQRRREKSKKVICGGVIYANVGELSLISGLNYGTIYGWVKRKTNYTKRDDVRDYYLNTLGLRYYEEKEDDGKAIKQRESNSENIKKQEVKTSILNSLPKICEDLIELKNIYEKEEETIKCKILNIDKIVSEIESFKQNI